MADVNVNAPAEQAPAMAPPTRTDDQILPRSSWVPVGKSNCYLDVEKSQSKPIYKISVDILKHTNFFRAFIASSTIPSIYIQEDVGRIYPIHPFFHRRQKESGTAYLGKEESQSSCDLKCGQYYNEYLEKVAKHKRYLAGEEGSDPDSPAPKPAKATKPKANKKSKHLAPKAAPVTKPTAAKASKSTSSQQPKPKHALIMPQEKKRKLIKETSDKPSPAKRSKRGLVTKRRKSTSPLRLVDEFVDKGVPENEPRFDDEEANLQRVVVESLKDVLPTHRGLLSPVVFREPDFGRRQLLPEVQGKGKEKVIEEQVAHTLIDLNTPKRKSTTDQCIFQRRTLETAEPTGPSTHHEDEKVTLADVETNTEDLLAHTEKTGEEVSNTMVLGTESGGHDEKQGGPDPENEKTTAKTKAESMVSVTLQQDTSTIPHMTTPMIDLTSKPNSLKPPPPLPPTGLFGTFGSSGASGSSQVPPPPPPPPSTNQEGQSDGSIASSSSKTAVSAEYTAWTTSDTRFKPSVSSILEDLHMDDDSAPNKQVHSSDDEDIENDHIPKVNLMQN
uniref:Histone deacetylase 14 n=1 Tax=Tanacetum cinerariifolium TaxID=118510 RepID=A0A699H830_TANCI|nr:hypothetical protein [Tanacetum cinerariifolium]